MEKVFRLYHVDAGKPLMVFGQRIMSREDEYGDSVQDGLTGRDWRQLDQLRG